MDAKIPARASQARSIIEALDSDRRLRLLAILYNAEGEGRLSFRELGDEASLQGSSLAQHLRPLVQTGLVLNTYEPSETREYSFYEISPLGRDWMQRVELVDQGTDTAWLVPA